MTSIGRGRGWARVEERENVLRRPGQSVSPKTSDVDELVNRIYSDISIEATTPCDRLNELISFMSGLPDQESAENLDRLWQLALDDRCFAIKLMKLYRSNHQSVTRQPSAVVRRELWRRMQECYERREEVRQENPLHFTNLTWMLGVVVQNGSKSTTRILGPALINCLCLLLETATEEDTETVAIQIYLTGILITKELQAADLPTKTENTVGLDEVVNKARKILIHRNVSARSRALLLLIIDFARQNYEPLTGDLQVFYAAILGANRTQDHDSKVRTGREFNIQSYLYGILTKGMESTNNENQTTITQEFTSNESSQQQAQNINRSGGSSRSVPRAIRGSGAGKNSKEYRIEKRSPRDHKEKLTNEQVWSAKQNMGSKVWGHDDRFDNDYE